ncbi:UDP-D-galactose:(glucosyl)lipopolysaccharide-1,6-D-galactosyltransferase [Paenibacillus larvae subsp. larvae]|uniref:UDP-D-galactose:(Glucosyl)lipopolysaccharide-1, 6-D-galactosyltransferase n=1 Tax=Paenibacillus larvae subsp. larvae TaxID=147375 RepID=A0A2L1U737_9BACL|nr:glycosyltransferase family 4 protein [Paenibacillus larvae]AQT84956.1 glycosyl transferase family 1 [Paenibacillus larvae subsp. pulvifaciens]AQZ46959.1 glycosyl transferase family 1 [Paenibacillus larvae subsp. pulvifaciens]AVF28733.1 UDP-D-galactose:(glucosyl)lipopolysaccharide-1,6-D-galactosyltransferase [Paenibacillus larvae subsp. larvae]AVF33239.1 UDP-D-galactose:(glucosyl)lipopolysaccharide-1,6-D-galactosyltransferase [Paenibacillus larvae subsp. larvae]MBH0343010.1 glycosyl transfer
MNVLFAYYVPSGGVDSLNRHRCRGLLDQGHQGHCLYYYPGSGQQNANGIPTFITNDDEEIRQLIRQVPYDVVVATTDYCTFPRFRNLGYAGKFILEIQGYGPQHVARSELTKGISCINAYASALLNPKTAHIAALFDELFPAIPKFHFNNPFDSNSFTYRPCSKYTNPIIAWVGRLEDNKNWREFLQIAYHLVHLHNSNIRIWMFEDPNLSSAEERAAFTSELERLRLKDHLTLYQNVPNEQMQSCFSIIGDSGGFLCLTSKEEGGPYAVLEAMSCRCPILSSRKDGVMSTLQHNVTGKLYTLGNVGEAFLEAIELMHNPTLREQIRANAQARVISEFSIEQYIQNFLGMLRAI